MSPSNAYHQEFAPPEELREVIRCFWYTRMELGEMESGFEVMPDGYVEIVFHFGGNCRIVQDGEPRPLPSPFVMGLLDQPARLRGKGRLEVIGVRCFPWTVLDVLGLPSATEQAHLAEHPIAGLQPALSELVQSGALEEALVRVERYFLDARPGITIDETLFKAGAAMREANGTMPVHRVAAAAHATVRTLERKFKQSSGHTVKDVSGLIRFEQARNHLWLHPHTSIAGLAHDLGYTDQSHLTREFKRYSGITPAAFARKAKKGE